MPPSNPRPDNSVLKVNVTTHSITDSARSPIAPTTPDTRKPKLKAQLTLRQAWKDAEEQFHHDSGGKSLSQNLGGKESVLRRWQRAYEQDDSYEQKRSEQMATILNNVLNGIELVGAFAFQAASTVFPPADMCFNAISFLIDAPRQIQKVYDGLKELFQKVEEFMVKFRIYQRIDDKYGLDEDLVYSTNRLLISFVKICGLATKLLDGGKWQSFKTGFKVVLFRDDSGVSDELDNFQRLAEHHSMLTGTVTLEHVLESGEDVKQVLTKVNTLVADSNDEKTAFVNKDRLSSIEGKLFKRPPPSEELNPAFESEDLLPETFAVLQENKAYMDWENDSKSSRAILALYGNSGSGKSRLLDAVREHLDGLRKNAERDDPSTYVALYSFVGKRKTKANVAHALRVLAFQVARQSTMYAKDLLSSLGRQQDMEKIRVEDDTEKVWDSLRLSKFTVPRPSNLYILLDEPPHDFYVFLKTLTVSLTNRSSEYPTLRVLLTTSADERSSEGEENNGIPVTMVNEVNKKLVVSFVNDEMRRLGIFQDADRATRLLRKDILTKLIEAAGDDINFNNIRRMIKKIQDALEDGLPGSVIDTLFQEVSLGTEEEGKTTLLDLQKNLGPYDMALLSSILMWMMGTEDGYIELVQLEAALRLEKANLPIEPLSKRIKHRFSTVLSTIDGFVFMDSSVQEYLTVFQNRPEAISIARDESSITLDISIKNASTTLVKQFVWNLNEHMMSGKFDFEVAKPSLRTLQLDKVEMYLTITRLCFQLVNEGWDAGTEAMLPYARSDFSRHLKELQTLENRVDKSGRRMIGEGLVTFLNDSYIFDQHHQSYGGGWWMTDYDNTSAIRFWLSDSETVSQLPLKEQRWVTQALKNDGPLGFMLDKARSIGRRWLKDCRSESYALFDWIDSYLTAVQDHPESRIEPTPDDSIQNQQDGGNSKGLEDSGVVVDEPIETSPSSRLGDQVDQEGDVKINRDSAEDHYETEGDAGDHKVGQDLNERTGEPPENKSTSPEAAHYVAYADLTMCQKIDRALEWTVSQGEVVQNAAYHCTLGDTYFRADEYQQALEHYTIAAEDDVLRHYALHRLAMCCTKLEQTDAVIQHASESLSIYEQKAQRDELDEFEANNYIEYLKHWAQFLEDQGKHSKALELREKVLKRKPDDLLCCWAVLKLHCVVDDSQESALEFLESWSKDDNRFNGQSPALSLLEIVDQDDFTTQILPIARKINNESLRLRFLTVLAEATGAAGKEPLEDVHSRLHYLRGVTSALSTSSEQRDNAIQFWRKVLTELPQGTQSPWATYRLLRQASYAVTKHEFEKLRAKLSSGTQMSYDARKDMHQHLQNHVDRTVKICPAFDVVSGISSAECFVVALCSMSDFSDEARKMCRREMSQALEILSDDDPDNDSLGISLMAQIFCHLGDKISALTAFSLLDQRILRQRLTAVGELQHEETIEDRYDGGWLRMCDACSKDLYSSDVKGSWMCRFCPNFDLCPACKELHENGALKLESCDPSHVPWFLHFVHSGYSAEELEPNKVLIDWEYVDDGEGGFTRKGGHIVELSEWVEQLRTLWNLPKPSGNNSRAQQ